MRPLLLCALLACSAAPGEGGGPPPKQEAAPIADDPAVAPQLQPGELLRRRGTGGACSDSTLLVVFDDGRLVETSREGCMMGKPGPGRPPPTPEVRSGRLDASELDALLALLAAPAVMQAPPAADDPPGSAHPDVSELVARTPTGEARARYGKPPATLAALDARLDELHLRLLY